MEVVSPLTFARSNQGGKRRFGSPIPGVASGGHSATAEDFDMMDDCSGYGFQATKRRKKAGGDSSFSFQSKENTWSQSPFAHAASRSPPAAVGPSAKRSRTPQHDDGLTQKLQELQQMVEQQGAEIHRLKSEKDSVEASAAELSSQHAKAEHENKILKRAVAIQQERGNQMTGELEAARQFKVQAEDRIRRLEQMNLTLQYQLQANSAPTGSDFMGFNPRPPDVY
jgi:hypothetical protein